MELSIHILNSQGQYLRAVKPSRTVSLEFHPRINDVGEMARLTVSVQAEPSSDDATPTWVEQLPRTARLMVRRWSDKAGTWVPEWYGLYCGREVSWSDDGSRTYELRFRDWLSVLQGRPYRPASFTPNGTPAYTADVWTAQLADVVFNDIAERALADVFALPGASVAADQNIGNVIDWRADFSKDCLTHLQEVAKAGGLDLGVVYGLDGTARYESRWLWGVDRTQGNAAGNDAVVLSVDLGTLGPGKYEESWTDSPNYVISRGQNDLGDTLAVIAQDSAAQIAYGLWPVDIAASGGLSQMRSEAQAKLAEGKLKQAYNFPLPESGRYVYGVHYEIGDLVTAVLPVGGGLALTVQVTGVDVVVGENGVTATAVLGTDGDVMSRIGYRLRHLSRRVRAAESRGL